MVDPSLFGWIMVPTLGLFIAHIFSKDKEDQKTGMLFMWLFVIEIIALIASLYFNWL